MAQATEPNVATKGGRRIIERPRLLRLLDETTARTILLIAPAGYGKTTLARQWMAGQTGAYWYTARAGSADIAQLVMGLAEALDPAAPGFNEYVSQLVRAMPNPTQNATEIADGIVNFAGDLGTVTIVVDDLHLVAENETASAMLRTLQSASASGSWSPPACGRPGPPHDSRCTAELLEVGSDQLALTDEEAHGSWANRRAATPTSLSAREVAGSRQPCGAGEYRTVVAGRRHGIDAVSVLRRGTVPRNTAGSSGEVDHALAAPKTFEGARRSRSRSRSTGDRRPGGRVRPCESRS